MKNQYIQLNVMPSLGGRILNYQLGPHSFLWWNPTLEGNVPPASGVGPHGEWLNWGGDKLWPAPQGWDGVGQWPGPPDGVLDGSPQKLEILAPHKHGVGLRLTSPADSRSGIQFRRTIQIFEGSSQVHVSASMINTVSHPVRWGIWTNTQLDASNRDGQGWNTKFYTYAPINPHSTLPGGYRTLFGPVPNPQLESSAASGVLRLHFGWVVGKVGLDSNAGWLANVDGSTGNVFVQMFTYQAGMSYPDDSSIAVWTNGIGMLHAFGRMEAMSADPIKNPYIVESEVISPFITLAHSQQTHWDYDWYSANIGGNYPVLSCTRFGCIAEEFRARAAGRSLLLSGRFGVFYGAHAAIEFIDGSGKSRGTIKQLGFVSPMQPLVLASTNIAAPAKAVTVRIVLFKKPHGARIGELAQAAIAR